ncbi:hypothetical protein AHS81_23885 [Salmonella enterica]|nr:hypothetical protein [Salmonella enterica]
MSIDSDDGQEGDEELAPMVDGLSGALCIFILITTVFMISGMNTVVTGLGKAYVGSSSRVDYFKNTIYFDKVISLSNDDYTKINKTIHDNKKQHITIEAYNPSVSDVLSSRTKRDLTYNLLQFKEHLEIYNMQVTLKISDDDFCDTKSSCIKWSIN